MEDFDGGFQMDTGDSNVLPMDRKEDQWRTNGAPNGSLNGVPDGSPHGEFNGGQGNPLF